MALIKKNKPKRNGKSPAKRKVYPRDKEGKVINPISLKKPYRSRYNMRDTWGYKKSYGAVDRAFRASQGFYGLSGLRIALLLNAALRDEFTPMKKRARHFKKGDHLTLALRDISKETLNLAEATPQGQA